jgi:hypothetical protein
MERHSHQQNYLCAKTWEHVHTRKPLVGQNMESAFTRKTINAPIYGNGIHVPKQVVCQNMHIHTGKPLVCQNVQIAFTMENF